MAKYHLTHKSEFTEEVEAATVEFSATHIVFRHALGDVLYAVSADKIDTITSQPW